MEFFILFLYLEGNFMAKTHTKRKRRRHPILKLILLLIIIIAVIGGITIRGLHSKLGKVQTKSLDQSQIVTVNNDPNMDDYTNYAFFEYNSSGQKIMYLKSVLLLLQ